MGESKKYYWLKLHKDFFKQHEIKIIEGMGHGKELVLLYIKLLSESVSHGGNLRFSNEIPYTPQMISALTSTDIMIVQTAMDMFQQLNMIKILEDGTICMSEVEKMIGAETMWAEKKRAQRQKKDNVSIVSPNVNENNAKVPYQKIIEQYNSICTRLSKVRTLSEARKRLIKTRFNQYGEDMIIDVFVKANLSDFLCGEKGWRANFDWLMKESNFAKVLDGNYTNSDGKLKDEKTKSETDRKNEELLNGYFIQG